MAFFVVANLVTAGNISSRLRQARTNITLHLSFPPASGVFSHQGLLLDAHRNPLPTAGVCTVCRAERVCSIYSVRDASAARVLSSPHAG